MAGSAERTEQHANVAGQNKAYLSADANVSGWLWTILETRVITPDDTATAGTLRHYRY